MICLVDEGGDCWFNTTALTEASLHIVQMWPGDSDHTHLSKHILPLLEDIVDIMAYPFTTPKYGFKVRIRVKRLVADGAALWAALGVMHQG